MQTPVKSSSKFLSSNFQATQSDKHTVNFSKSTALNDFDLIKTPKQSSNYYPFMDRKLRVEELRHIKNNRARIIDWFLQIFSSYQLQWECFWFAIELLDSLIADFNYVNTQNIHLVGIVCCFISAKMKGNANLKLKHVVYGLGHSKFTSTEIVKEEANIVTMVLSTSNFQRITVYSFLMEKYHSINRCVLSKAMEMICVAFLRPDRSYEAMGVSTYRELVDFVMTQVCFEKKIPILENIRKEIKQNFGKENTSILASQMLF